MKVRLEATSGAPEAVGAVVRLGTGLGTQAQVLAFGNGFLTPFDAIWERSMLLNMLRPGWSVVAPMLHTKANMKSDSRDSSMVLISVLVMGSRPSAS